MPPLPFALHRALSPLSLARWLHLRGRTLRPNRAPPAAWLAWRPLPPNAADTVEWGQAYERLTDQFLASVLLFLFEAGAREEAKRSTRDRHKSFQKKKASKDLRRGRGGRTREEETPKFRARHLALARIPPVYSTAHIASVRVGVALGGQARSGGLRPDHVPHRRRVKNLAS